MEIALCVSMILNGVISYLMICSVYGCPACTSMSSRSSACNSGCMVCIGLRSDKRCSRFFGSVVAKCLNSRPIFCFSDSYFFPSSV